MSFGEDWVTRGQKRWDVTLGQKLGELPWDIEENRSSVVEQKLKVKFNMDIDINNNVNIYNNIWVRKPMERILTSHFSVTVIPTLD